jgi:MYXO-CTERM domain-containing protein
MIRLIVIIACAGIIHEAYGEGDYLAMLAAATLAALLLFRKRRPA